MKAEAGVRVLIVDDSGFFRRRIRELLTEDPAIEVVGEADNGRAAVQEVRRLHPDVVTMDIEMPEMDGIAAVREIMRRCPTPVLMFSSLTYDGAQATLDALDAGAVDFLPKRFSDLSADAGEARRLLRQRVRLVGQRSAHPQSVPKPGLPTAQSNAAWRTRPGLAHSSAAAAPSRGVRLVIIGTSTGGPVALQRVLASIPERFPLPLLVVQHMPGAFTGAFAARLDQLCRIEVCEAANGDVLRPGVALLAPGGRQLGLRCAADRFTARIFDSGADQIYKPSLDVTFMEAVRHCPGQVLGVVLTGMGSDGYQGARELKRAGSILWAQDAASSVIYGMPAAVTQAGLVDEVLALEAVGPALARLGS